MARPLKSKSLGKKTKAKKRIYVQWYDHMGEQKGWIKREDMEGKLPLVESLGFLVQETEEFLLISHSVGVDEDEYFDAFYIMKNAIKMRKWVR